MRIEDVAGADDTSALWTALVQAKGDGDARLVRAIEQRMRELTTERRFAHLSDEELRQRIDGLTGNRAPEGMLGHAPGLGGGEGGSSAHVSACNEASRRDQHAGIEAALTALQDEWRRRRS